MTHLTPSADGPPYGPAFGAAAVLLLPAGPFCAAAAGTVATAARACSTSAADTSDCRADAVGATGRSSGFSTPSKEKSASRLMTCTESSLPTPRNAYMEHQKMKRFSGSAQFHKKNGFDHEKFKLPARNVARIPVIVVFEVPHRFRSRYRRRPPCTCHPWL